MVGRVTVDDIDAAVDEPVREPGARERYFVSPVRPQWIEAIIMSRLRLTSRTRFSIVSCHHLRRRLKNCTACSCRSASSRVLSVPRFLRLPVFGSIFREYSRYWPDFSLQITLPSQN